MNLRRLFSPFVFEAEGAPTGAPPAGTPPAATEAPAAPAAPVAPDFFYAAEERPDWLPETFYDPDRKGVAIDKLATSYRELQGRFSQKNETLKAELARELREGVPETPDAYTFEIPEGIVPKGFELKAPPADDPLLAETRALMHELGAKPEQWQKLMGTFLQWQVGQAPNLDAERAKMGEGAEERLNAVDMWLAKELPEAQYMALAQNATNADFMLAMEGLMRKASGGGGLPTGLPSGGMEQTGPAEAKAMMNHADYNHPEKGLEMRRKVAAFFGAGGKIPRTGTANASSV